MKSRFIAAALILAIGIAMSASTTPIYSVPVVSTPVHGAPDPQRFNFTRGALAGSIVGGAVGGALTALFGSLAGAVGGLIGNFVQQLVSSLYGVEGIPKTALD